jgi:hypothetical protein
MTRRTQNILYHLLPVVFWLLAAGGITIWEIFNLQSSIFNYIPAFLAWLSVVIIRHIPRHTSAVEPCFQTAILLGIAAYWLPSVLFVILPIWGYLIYRRLLDLRALLATFIGLATVAIWIAVGNVFQISNFKFQIAANLFAWIPTGVVLLAWLGSTIARQTLRER